MLKSVYDNGGFYIGRYEVGTTTARYAKGDELTTPIIQRDAYPYDIVTCKQAQEKAKQLAVGEKTSSLMFGIQWDLILKFIEEKGALTQEQLKTNSGTWGNYHNETFDIKREKALYTESPSIVGSWNSASTYTKPWDPEILLTTGATDRNSILGIYDLAGNVREWTLEKGCDNRYPCADRGGDYGNSGNTTAAHHHCLSANETAHGFGFRSTLW